MFKIMAVEDSAATLDFYREFFGEAGFEVKTAEDAFSAITLYQQFKPDLVILDLGIPAGGGMLVFNTLRTNLNDPVPIIFSTGKPEELPNFTHIHNVSVLKKPVDPDVLMAEVKRLLPKISDRPAGPTPLPSQSGCKVLVVDNDPRRLDLYAGMLSGSGFEIQAAGDATAAEAKFRDFKPAIVIVDVDMPADGGRKVFEHLRVQLAAPTPVIFCTATLAAAVDLEKNTNVLILKKPVTPGVFAGAVKDLLTARGAGDREDGGNHEG